MILNALIQIKNVEDSSLTFRRSCREGVCGSCSMNIDCTNSLACLRSLNIKSKFITIYPLPHTYIIKDLVPDLSNITFRKSENKENAKVKGENFEHVQSYARALRQVDNENPGIFEDGDRFFNLDETAVNGEFGKRVKVFGSADTHHGGFSVSSANSGTGKCSAVTLHCTPGHRRRGAALPAFDTCTVRAHLGRYPTCTTRGHTCMTVVWHVYDTCTTRVRHVYIRGGHKFLS
ncbi:unnamed protein product [Chondrus crispus]|uniref:2Fe-2S ferredoxin-type domain-containing protein n=1 Tax=Chondrus crispus TaxID=2769 RepID=R7Q3Z5_CHOCR|nr:unnamed protein product [Chondrus crispus]CDF32200.1 unnamed protein product [Chondrus crispus]|eukprot:XP_005711865.1 unnamed protein product [Chondrus crispus]